jgi:hypothetical protein
MKTSLFMSWSQLRCLLDTAAPAAAIQPDANKAATMSSVQKTLEVKR